MEYDLYLRLPYPGGWEYGRAGISVHIGNGIACVEAATQKGLMWMPLPRAFLFFNAHNRVGGGR